jgi:putative PIN family toxin of toxin-antitoxin system
LSERIVLDTNVWLDWLVFDDAGIEPLKQAHAMGVVDIAIDTSCEQELARVLAYPRRKTTLNAAQQADCLARCREITSWFARNDESGQTGQGTALPACQDPDDQKFLELARDCGAHFLVTRDRALLDLARPKQTALPFRIVTPAECAMALQPPLHAGLAS